MSSKSNGFQETLKKYLVPIANKVERQPHLQAIKEGMMSIVPIIIVGSLCLLSIAIMNMLPNGGAKDFIGSNLDKFMLPFNFTMGIISLYAAFFIAESLAKKYKLNSLEVAITAVIIQFILGAEVVDGAIKTGYLDAQGLFVSIIVAILVVEITRFMNRKGIVLKLPKEVPSVVSKSFNNLIPMIFCVILFSGLAVLAKGVTGDPVPKIIMSVLAPAINSLDSVFAVIIILLITQLLWFFGLHGAAITSSIWMPIAAKYISENASNIAAGGQATHIFTIGFYYSFLQVTGSGITLGLVILMMRSKCKSLNSVGKVSIIPSIFGINEPVIFGAPLVMNPYMFIPFVFGPVLVGALDFLAFSSGLVGKPIIEPPGFMPAGVGAFLLTLDWKAVVLCLGSIVLMTLIYYPFFKIMEREELKKEAEASAVINDEDFDF
ncbi:PTS sugar transporter subunit IIC [Clostridium hydrogeniformans]|uniref:PTS sugar transporter subunit IIC n=1 Tax=Clostridium hydrogeniformans TaxID=349933 RepID=UPI000489433C|nr:PTS transporter subunit EIIC [Clostridium hydrogeniformans]